MNALKYYRDLVVWDKMNAFFASNLEIMLNSLIFKNMGVSEEENIMFKEEPESFINFFFEASDLNSRRYATNQLLKSVVR